MKAWPWRGQQPLPGQRHCKPASVCGTAQVEDMLKRSFAEFHAQRAAPAGAQELAKVCLRGHSSQCCTRVATSTCSVAGGDGRLPRCVPHTSHRGTPRPYAHKHAPATRAGPASQHRPRAAPARWSASWRRCPQRPGPPRRWAAAGPRWRSTRRCARSWRSGRRRCRRAQRGRRGGATPLQCVLRSPGSPPRDAVPPTELARGRLPSRVPRPTRWVACERSPRFPPCSSLSSRRSSPRTGPSRARWWRGGWCCGPTP
jgi:hypothetical protein